MVETYLSRDYSILIEHHPLTNLCVSVDVTFLIKRPDSHFVRPNRILGIRCCYENTMPTGQGDIDNYVNFFLDSIDGFSATTKMLIQNRRRSCIQQRYVVVSFSMVRVSAPTDELTECNLN